jgi:glycosyltransferase involved in cell wall biosynthesis
MPHSQTLVTVIIAVTNIKLNFNNLIRILDDGSNLPIHYVLVHDTTQEPESEELAEILKQDRFSQVDFLSVKTGNPGDTRNAGIRFCHEDWVSFWDVDDAPNVQNFYEMIIEAGNGGYEVAIGSFCRRDVISGRSRDFMLNMKRDYRQLSKSPGIWRFALKRSTLENLRFCNLRMGEDQLFLIDLGLDSKKVFLTRKLVYLYRVNLGFQLTSNPKARLDLLGCIELTLKRVTQSPNGKNFDFALKLLVRQIITTFKIVGLLKGLEITLSVFRKITGFRRKILFTLFYFEAILGIMWEQLLRGLSISEMRK